MLISTSNKESEKEIAEIREKQRNRDFIHTDMQVVPTSSAFLFPFMIVIWLS